MIIKAKKSLGQNFLKDKNVLKKIADITAKQLNKKQEEDEDSPKKISSKNIIFGCTGTIGEIFPHEKISNNIPNLVKKIRYTQNKFI